ncbi:MAG TPA: hypothetical protein PK629_09580 [Oscillospiraceae bacterium]|nr:hypothetical protein [Oscillospiraceae bacterium]HPF56237.1 hypothetical protein [Clostridiales bacterium]HPK34945.1 hypothetical protein [Oscillospiraceae bacterium]HPR75346.1 hypothetical protein [Oscillospiraceae bacterium]
MNDEKNKNNPGEISDEIFERIAAEKRRKLNQLISSFEERERSKNLDEDTRQTIHRDLFPGERKKQEHPRTRSFEDNQLPLDTQISEPQVGRFNEEEDIKIRPIKKAVIRPEPEPAQEEEDDVRIYSPVAHIKPQPEQEPQTEQELKPEQESEPEIQAEQPVEYVPVKKAEPVPENEKSDNAQELLLKSRREKMENFVLDTTASQDEDIGEEFEFTRNSNTEEIAADLARWTRKKVLRVVVCLVIFIASLLIVLSPALPMTALPYDLSASAETSAVNTDVFSDDGTLTIGEANQSPVTVSGSNYEVNPNKQQVRVIIGVLLALNIIVLAVSVDTLSGGLVDLFKLCPTGDSAASLIWLFTTVQGIILMVTPESFAAGVFGVFLPFAAFAAMIAHLTGLLRQVREKNGFEVISNPGAKFHLRLQNEGNSAILQRPEEDEDAVAGVFVKADFASDYFAMSDSEDGADRINKVLVPAVTLFGLLLAIAVTVIRGGNFAMFFTVWTAAVCMLIPLASGIICMLPQVRASGVNKKHGIAVSNQCAFDDAYDMTSMLFTDNEIFSTKTMVLNGIKTFSGKRMDEAIILAASAVEKRGGPLKELFTGILSENEGYLLPVDNETVYQPEKGIVCWISGKRVILGSREFISEYDIVLPSDDFDKKFTKRNRCLIYLAFGGELMAVLLVTYKIDSDTAHALRALAKQRVRLLVDTRDPCIKSTIISKQLGLPDDYVVIIDTQGKTALEKILRERTALKAGAVCDGKMTDRIRTVLSCFKLRKSLSVGFALQAGLMVLALGALLVSVFSATLSTMTILLVLAAQGIILLLSAIAQCLPGYRNLW